MALLNPRFADAGASPGLAAHWTLTAVTSLQVLAGFGGTAREDFERWSPLLASLEDVTVVRAFYGDDGSEDFKQAWENSAYLVELADGRLETCPFGEAAVETWPPATPFLRDWESAVSVDGLTEDFVWPDYVFIWADVVSAALQTETFSGVWSHTVTL
jgi:hypothetical protein